MILTILWNVSLAAVLSFLAGFSQDALGFFLPRFWVIILAGGIEEIAKALGIWWGMGRRWASGLTVGLALGIIELLLLLSAGEWRWERIPIALAHGLTGLIMGTAWQSKARVPIILAMVTLHIAWNAYVWLVLKGR